MQNKVTHMWWLRIRMDISALEVHPEEQGISSPTMSYPAQSTAPMPKRGAPQYLAIKISRFHLSW